MDIISKLKELTNYKYVKLTTRGNVAIRAAVSVVEGIVLIPEEGGWLEYQKIENHIEVKCKDAVIDLADLKKKIQTMKIGALLYQNPGGYFAQQPMEEIYKVCKENNCLVILDVAGSIGTKLCDGNYADIIVGSFGRWKPVNAEVGGFISTNNEELFNKIVVDGLNNEALSIIKEKLDCLNERISFLKQKRKKIIDDLENFNIIHPTYYGLVVVVRFENDEEKKKIVDYCIMNGLGYTECPRYIRLNERAISIEVKRCFK
jgi:hypothetical protein